MLLLHFSLHVASTLSEDRLRDCAILEVVDHNLETVGHASVDGGFDETWEHACRVKAQDLL